MEEHMRKRLKEIIEYVVFTMEDTTLIETTVAFNHIHVLLQSSLPVAKNITEIVWSNCSINAERISRIIGT